MSRRPRKVCTLLSAALSLASAASRSRAISRVRDSFSASCLSAAALSFARSRSRLTSSSASAIRRVVSGSGLDCCSSPAICSLSALISLSSGAVSRRPRKVFTLLSAALSLASAASRSRAISRMRDSLFAVCLSAAAFFFARSRSRFTSASASARRRAVRGSASRTDGAAGIVASAGSARVPEFLTPPSSSATTLRFLRRCSSAFGRIFSIATAFCALRPLTISDFQSGW